MHCKSLPMALLRPRPRSFAFTGRTTALVLFLLLQALPPAGSPAKDGLQPAPGVLLVAGTQVRDPGFRESVIGGIGSMSRGGNPLFYGGPVGGHDLLMLRRADRAPDDWGAVVDRVFVTNSRMAMMDALMTARTAEEVRVYAGYAGWAAGQLEREIGRGDWYLLPADAALIFRRDMTKLWPELFRKSREIDL
jgi:putative transcriptional regulator